MEKFKNKLRGAISSAIGHNDNAKALQRPEIVFNGPVTIILGDLHLKKRVIASQPEIDHNTIPTYLTRRIALLEGVPPYEPK